MRKDWGRIKSEKKSLCQNRDHNNNSTTTTHNNNTTTTTTTTTNLGKQQKTILERLSIRAENVQFPIRAKSKLLGGVASPDVDVLADRSNIRNRPQPSRVKIMLNQFII